MMIKAYSRNHLPFGDIRVWKVMKLHRFSEGFRHVRNLSTEKDHILKHETTNVGVITLNRPGVMNTLTWTMPSNIYHTLKKWETEKKLVIMKGAGDKAFSAGADLKSLKVSKGHTILAEENVVFLNANINLLPSYKIPYVALINGITMGGGVGISLGGKYQVASDKTVWAMPEIIFGFYPNMGASYYLPKLPRKLGRYLGLTGRSIKGSDVVKVGLASHFCDTVHFEKLEQELMDCSQTSQVEQTLKKYNKTDLPDFSLAPVVDKINYCFSGDTIEEIILRLQKDGSYWAQDVVKDLNKLSPTSLKVSLRGLQNGEYITLRECLLMEYRLLLHFLKKDDIHEGIRALLEKDGNPKWTPSTLSAVSQEYVDSFFTEVSHEEKQLNLL
ncbi:hypothetical protein JTB14_027925 [Gonioctena quinquepunctata]|nr:hypothetical protein JTB14_027925 [Gonioctena quinquepunctata]